jgi:hypothetical protein
MCVDTMIVVWMIVEYRNVKRRLAIDGVGNVRVGPVFEHHLHQLGPHHVHHLPKQ